MGITLIEQIGILAGIVIGISSLIYAVMQSRHQRAYEQEQCKQAEARAEEQALKDRLYFLANLIVDKDIPRRSRQIFFDEYIAKGGNGSFVKYWYNEGKELEAKKGRMDDGDI
jgi:hypothetical protein